MQISNIDKLSPTKTAPTLQNKTTNSVTITLNQQDTNATNEYASSGLDSTKRNMEYIKIINGYGKNKLLLQFNTK